MGIWGIRCEVHTGYIHGVQTLVMDTCQGNHALITGTLAHLPLLGGRCEWSIQQYTWQGRRGIAAQQLSTLTLCPQTPINKVRALNSEIICIRV